MTLALVPAKVLHQSSNQRQVHRHWKYLSWKFPIRVLRSRKRFPFQTSPKSAIPVHRNFHTGASSVFKKTASGPFDLLRAPKWLKLVFALPFPVHPFPVQFHFSGLSTFFQNHEQTESAFDCASRGVLRSIFHCRNYRRTLARSWVASRCQGIQHFWGSFGHVEFEQATRFLREKHPVQIFGGVQFALRMRASLVPTGRVFSTNRPFVEFGGLNPLFRFVCFRPHPNAPHAHSRHHQLFPFQLGHFQRNFQF